MSKQQAKQLLDDYYAGTVSVDDAAAQLVAMIGAEETEAIDGKLTALLDVVQPQTTIWPCAVTVTVATSCSRWCD